MPGVPKNIYRECVICAERFPVENSNQKTCSDPCRAENKRRKSNAHHKRWRAEPDNRKTLRERSAAWARDHPDYQRDRRATKKGAPLRVWCRRTP